MKWVMLTIGACDSPVRDARMAGQALIDVGVELIGLDRVRDDRRLLGIVADLADVGIRLRQQARRRPLLLQRRVAAQARAQPAGAALAAGNRADRQHGNSSQGGEQKVSRDAHGRLRPSRS